MKKLFSLLIIAVFGFLMVSCNDDDDIQQVNVDYPTVYDITFNFIRNAPDSYGYNLKFDGTLLNQDIVLVYRKNNPTQSAPVWEPLPKTYFFGSNAMDYTFDFTTADVQLNLNADFFMDEQDADFNRTYLNGQTFRIVLVPAVYGKNSTDLSKLSYEEVISRFKINDKIVGTL